VIRDEMEQTRASLADKLGALETQVRETVSGAAEAVNSTVEGVKEAVSSVSDGVKEVVGSVSETVESVTESVTDTFNVPKHVENNPWLAFGAAVAAGVVLSQLTRMVHLPAPHPAASPERTPDPRAAFVPAQPPPQQHEESILGSVGSGAIEAIEGMMPDVKGVMNTVVSGLGGMAVGTVMNVIRELATESVPEQWKGEVSKLVNQVSDQLHVGHNLTRR